MKPALAIALMASILSLTGCTAGDVAKKATGIHTTTIKSIYAPKIYCDQVKDAVPDPGFEDEVAYRVVCLKNHQFGRNLLKACRQKPASVRTQYWAYNPAADKAGYITCGDLKRLGY
ncbi:MAG TPA: hypothetical protein VG816_14695 [Solirubrobacterales bacterium]|nr:hypothetical protein [Solirubrobacterales bacterium]